MSQEIYLSLKKILLCLQSLELELGASIHKMFSLLNKDEVFHLSTDSRKLKKRSIFIAIKGQNHDGHLFINEALKKELSFVFCEEKKGFLAKKTPFISLENTRKLWAYLCAEAFDSPHLKMNCIGITGTNGKTSTAWICQQILAQLSIKSLYIGTLGAYMGSRRYPLEHTTPDPSELFALLDQASKKGISFFIFEASSHGLSQERLGPIKCDLSIFTSFSRDHLDFHGSFENYWQAKLLLFEKYSKEHANALIHESLYKKFTSQVKNKKLRLLSYKSTAHPHKETSKKNQSEVCLLATKKSSSLIEVKTNNERFKGEIPYLGQHNCENFLAALLAIKALSKQDLSEELWPKLKSIPGRLSPVFSTDKDAPRVFVDFAHSPEALEKTLLELKKLNHKKIFLVFGCGGNRDTGKRQLMAQLAEKHAHRSYITDDNPRNEDPEKIISDICQGFQKQSSFVRLTPRDKAIEKAIFSAGTNDLVLIAGKGHENYQIIMDEKIPFDDHQKAHEALSQRQERAQ